LRIRLKLINFLPIIVRLALAGRRMRMALLTWDSDKYSVGVKSIDGQHGVLFGLINDLYEAMRKGQAQQLTGALLRKLVDYTKTHFTAEEQMLADAKYPGLAEHQVKHRALIKQVGEFTSRLEKGEIAINLDLMSFLSDWLTNHIQRVDKEYSPWLNQHGVQ
jgi:hemerythrin-like metal-binding protein